MCETFLGVLEPASVESRPPAAAVGFRVQDIRLVGGLRCTEALTRACGPHLEPHRGPPQGLPVHRCRALLPEVSRPEHRPLGRGSRGLAPGQKPSRPALGASSWQQTHCL